MQKSSFLTPLIFISLLIAGEIKGSAAWYELYKPDRWQNVPRDLKDLACDASRQPVCFLLGILHIHAASHDRENLERIAQVACEKAQTGELLDASLICGKAKCFLVADKSGLRAIEREEDSLRLSEMACEFGQVYLGDLSSKAAQKSDLIMRQTRKSSFRLGISLAKGGFSDFAQNAFLLLLERADRWENCLNIYEELMKLKNPVSAKKALSKTLTLLERNSPRCGTAWFLHVAGRCMENGSLSDAQLAASCGVKKELVVRTLLQHLPILASFQFQDLVHEAAQKIVISESKCMDSASLLRICKGLLEVQEGKAASQFCDKHLAKCTSLHSFQDLCEIIVLFYKHNNIPLVRKALRQLQGLCMPTDLLLDISKAGMVFYRASHGLLFAAALSQNCAQHELAAESAGNAISCALAQSYESPIQFLLMLEELSDNFRSMNLPYFAKKLDWYKVEAESPPIRLMCQRAPHLFDIYWTELEGARGCEIVKRRPCIVLTSVSDYEERGCVTVVPLSTKVRGTVTSIPLSVNNESQEARVDQIRSVDLSRLRDRFGVLPEAYRLQILLAVKNFIGQ